MLEVGNGMAANEDRTHFSMWCMLAAPLIAGNDLRTVNGVTLETLTNKDAISVDQDALGIEGFVYSAKDGVEVWFKPLSNDGWAMCILNRNKAAKQVAFNWKNEKVADSLAVRSAAFDTTTYAIRDVWAQCPRGTTQTALSREVPGRDVLMLLLNKQ
jgi:alpha-galactosidase